MREIWRHHVQALQPSAPVTSSSWPMSFVLGALATWRVTHLLVEEDGPRDVVLRARRAAGASALGRAMDCFYCSSIWVALPFAVGLTRRRSDNLFERVATWLALSGAACVLEQATQSDGASLDLHDVPLLMGADNGADAPTRPLVLTGTAS
jgi:hypothetical protein